MTSLIFDLETNGLLDTVTKVHCLVTLDEKGTLISYADQSGYRPISEGLAQLAAADLLIGHNILSYDVPVLQKVYPTWKTLAKIRDTLIMAKLAWPEIRNSDFAAHAAGKLPANMIGRYSLEAFGHRLGLHKGDYSADMEARGLDPWASWNQEMQEYCELDVRVTALLWERLQKRGMSEGSLDLEHDFTDMMNRQERNGVAFDEAAAGAFYAKLILERTEVYKRLHEAFPPRWRAIEVVTPPKTVNYKDPRRISPTAGAPFTRVERWSFDVAKSEDIVSALTLKYGWKPKNFARKTGKPKTDEDTLKILPYPEIPDILLALTLDKRLGQLAQGNQALMKVVKNGRIHGRVDAQGTITRRCAHKSPNLGQVPNSKSLYGKEFRSLFVADKGKVLVGFDVAGIQLRALAHYLAPYDGGTYIDVVCDGDVHSNNAKIWGIKSRDIGKTATYSYFFGCYPAKTGSIIIDDAAKAGESVVGWNAYKIGLEAQARFESGMKLDKMLGEAREAAKKRGGYVKALDGGMLRVREERTILAALLQSAEAIIVKKMGLLFEQILTEKGLIHGRDYWFALHVHDEQVVNTYERHAPTIAKAFEDALQQAGTFFNFRCPLSGEAKVGRSWADTK